MLSLTSQQLVLCIDFQRQKLQTGHLQYKIFQINVLFDLQNITALGLCQCSPCLQPSLVRLHILYRSPLMNSNYKFPVMTQHSTIIKNGQSSKCCFSFPAPTMLPNPFLVANIESSQVWDSIFATRFNIRNPLLRILNLVANIEPRFNIRKYFAVTKAN